MVAGSGARSHHQRFPVAPLVHRKLRTCPAGRAGERPRVRACIGWLSCVAFGSGLAAASAIAQQPTVSCGRGPRPWVALSFEGQDWSRPLRDNVIADLRAGLRLRGIDACMADAVPPASTTKPVASVALHVSASERVLVSIDVHDAITDKRVLRNVDLRTATPDARGLLLAQAADELLRASWVELSLPDAPVPAAPPPIEVRRAIQPHSVSQAKGTVLGARAAIEYYTGGQTLIGADAFVDFWLLDRLGASLALGLRTGLPAVALDGRIASSAVVAGAALLTPLWPARSRYNLAVMLGIQAHDIAISGEAARPLARGSARSAMALTAHAGVAAWWRWSDALRLALDFGPGLPLRSVSAYDDDREVMSTNGLQLRAALALGGVF